MMKTVRIFAAALAGLVATSASAQIADGSMAPAFTTTDLNGNTVVLQELLDAGHTVIIDVSATWCGPCWSYHNTGILESFYELFGPEGADIATVIMVEGDASTTGDDLIGTGANTWGDWTAGVDYPIVDDSSIADSYEITYYPTIFKVCPDGLVYEVGQLSLEGLIEEALAGCENAAEGAFPLMNSYTGDLASCGDAEIRVDVVNYGNADVTSASFDLYVGGAMEGTYPWSGAIAGGATETIVLTTISTPGNEEVEVIMTEANEVASEQHVNALILPATDATTWWNIDIHTDCWPEETTWEVRDAAGDIVQAGGPYATADADESVEFGLPSTGCYTFTLMDAYGDGLQGSQWAACEVNGSCVVSTATGDIYNYDGSYDLAMEAAGANATTVGVEEQASASSLNIYPNPVNGVANVNVALTNAAAVTIDVYNALGQKVMAEDMGTMMSGAATVQLDMSGLQAGVYTVNMTAGSEVSTVRVNVAR